MRHIFYPTQDASLYEQFSWKNSGLDEILEVGKSEDGLQSVHSVIQFDHLKVSASMAAETMKSAQIRLQLFLARAEDLDRPQEISVNFITQSWGEGSGYFYQNINVPYTASRNPSGGYIENNGANWKYRNSGSLWSIAGGSTGSFFTSSIISNPVSDVSLNVTTMAAEWISGSTINNGLLIKFTSESVSTNKGTIKFFSKDTHTIYRPQLVVEWDDQLYITGSLPTASAQLTNITIIPKNLKNKYTSTEIVRLDLSVRDKYPQRSFDIKFHPYRGNQYLPSSSYFSIIDQQNNNVIIPFSNFSKISCDGTTSFVKFDTTGMYAGRYYKVIFKVTNDSYTEIYDNNLVFSISNTTIG